MKEGCPSCIYSSIYVNENDIPDKRLTISALEKMIEMMETKKTE
ncbi:MAG: hypothetical protein QME14_00815 [Methanobacteriaceae archaeon]|nr:hypothetical protein [Methanobacteriaceae archaeon]